MAGIIQTLGSLARGAAKGAMASLDDMRKASDARVAQAEIPVEPPKSVMLDPYGMVASMGYRERPAAVSYATLKGMTYRAPVLGAIIQTRVNQVSSFARPQPNKYATGFAIKMRDSKASPSRAATAFMQKMEHFIHRTGHGVDPRTRDSLAAYLKKVTRDTLTFGHDATEIVPNRKNEPAAFYAVDATTIRLADNDRLNDADGQRDKIRYVQLYDGVIITEYTQEELAFGVRNPVSDIRMQGYGIGEMEMLIETATNLINTWDYNANFFKNGSAPKGMLNFKGNLPGEMIDAFRRHWTAMMQGVENSWRTPISNSPEGVEWIGMQQSNRDMEMSAFNEVLIKAACGVFAIDPAEINFSFGNQGQAQTLAGQSNQEKYVQSQERGLRPLLSHFSSIINTHVLWPIDPDFKFEFVGLDALTRDQAADLHSKEIKTFRTINEVRALEDLKPLPDKLGEIILDPTYLQNKSMAEMGPGGQAPGGQPDGQPAGGAVADQDDGFDPEDEEAEDAGKSFAPGHGRLAGSHQILIPGMREVALPETMVKSYTGGII